MIVLLQLPKPLELQASATALGWDLILMYEVWVFPLVGKFSCYGLDMRCPQKLTCETMQEGLEEK